MSPLSIIICVLGLGLLAAAHEIGHFLVAHRLGIKVEELSIFVGPSLFSWKRKGVVYHIRLIPFGAYVRFPGADDEDSGISNPDSYYNQPRWKRLLVSLAGPSVNVILGILIFIIVFSNVSFLSTKIDEVYTDTQMAETNAMPGDEILAINGRRVFTDYDIMVDFYFIPDADPVTMTLKSQETGKNYTITLNPTITRKYRLGVTVKPGLDKNGGWEIAEVDPSQNGGNPVLKSGDSLIAVNGTPVTDSDYANVISGSNGSQVTATVIRDGVSQDITLTTTIFDTANERGITLEKGSGFGSVIEHSILYSVSVVKVSIEGLRQVASGDLPATDAISGPVGIASLVSDVVDEPTTNNSQKISDLGLMAGLISVGLAFSNMLPLPGLDGNALVLIVVEMIRGKKLSLRTEQIINAVGFVVLIGLVIFALYSDILRLT